MNSKLKSLMLKSTVSCCNGQVCSDAARICNKAGWLVRYLNQVTLIQGYLAALHPGGYGRTVERHSESLRASRTSAARADRKGIGGPP